MFLPVSNLYLSTVLPLNGNMPKMDPVKKTLNRLKAVTKITQLTVQPVAKSPDTVLGELFRVVQLSRVHPDGKTFVDLVPSAKMRSIARAYERESTHENFDLHAFVAKHFAHYDFSAPSSEVQDGISPEEHIGKLWSDLTRSAPKAVGSLIPLPNPYVVPGGRFQEQFYWDAYFVMLGLETSGRPDLTDGMMANYSHMFRKFGFIPTGNRTYFTSRSQPPFYGHMVQLIARRKGGNYLASRLPYLLQEDLFWNKSAWLGLRRTRRIRMPDGSRLNRYYDNLSTPRPESYSEDVETGERSPSNPKQAYLDLRAGAESGWDFSGRWFDDPQLIETIRTTDIVPVDLNCLLYQLEMTIAECYRKALQFPLAHRYQQRAAKRQQSITNNLWDDEAGYFFDFDLANKRRTGYYSLAGAYPLYVGLATQQQADRVARVIEDKFLQDGGVVTSLTDTGQQWDWPNGWAPLQWTTIVGLRRYGHHELADQIKYRWLAACEATYANQGKFVEKYNVIDPAELGGGGEYVLQDGFGWTNGVFMALKSDLDHDIIKNPAPKKRRMMSLKSLGLDLGATRSKAKQVSDSDRQ